MSLVKFSEFRNSFINQCHTISSAVGNTKEESIDLFTQIKYQLGYGGRQYNQFLVSHRNKKTISTELFFSLDSLTLRRLMSYIYMEHPFLMFLDHTQRRSTVGRTHLDE